MNTEDQKELRYHQLNYTIEKLEHIQTLAMDEIHVISLQLRELKNKVSGMCQYIELVKKIIKEIEENDD